MSANRESPGGTGQVAPDAMMPIGVRTRAVVSTRWVLAALATLAAVATVVFVLLPGWLTRPPAVAQANPVAAPATVRAPDAREAVRQRLAAEEARARYETRLEAVRAQGADAWAAGDLGAAIGVAGAAAAAVAAGDHATGAQRYDEASQRLADIAARADKVYAEALERGAAAIQAQDQAQAIEAFRTALAIRPDAAAARAGLARAEGLDRVLAEMRVADGHAQAGEWEAAREGYARAARLDPAFAPAQEGLARAGRQVAGERFAQSIARGIAHLERAEWSAAEQAFQAAARLRPGDRSAADGLARAQSGREHDRLARLRRDAQAFETAERWSEALAAYRSALALDPALEFAQRGAERSEHMVKLHAALDTLLADPKRLYSPEVRADARRALAAAVAARAGGPRLAQARQRLEAALRRATTPVAVRLTSDDATEVTVNRVGALGRFQAREVPLTPGTYTVVGSRTGYKDVRIELTVDPDKPSPSVFVACREPV